MLCAEASILMLVCTCRHAQACVADKALCCRPVDRASQYNLCTSSCGVGWGGGQRELPTQNTRMGVCGAQAKGGRVMLASASVCVSLCFSLGLSASPCTPSFKIMCFKDSIYFMGITYSKENVLIIYTTKPFPLTNVWYPPITKCRNTNFKM